MAPHASVIHVAPHPELIAEDGQTHHLFVVTEGSAGYFATLGPGSVSMLDSSGRVLATTRVGFAPEAIAIDARRSRAFVLNVGSSTGTISILDTRNGSLLRTVPVGTVISVQDQVIPEAIAVDDLTGRVFVLLEGAVGVLDVDTGALLRTVSLPGVSSAVAVDAPAGHVIVAGAAGITLLDATSGRILSVASAPVGCTVAVDTHIHRAAVVLPDGTPALPKDRIAILETTSGVLLHSIQLGNVLCLAQPIAVDPTNDHAFVINEGAQFTGLISIIDLRTGKLLRTISQAAATSEPVAVAVDSQRHRVYVCAETWPPAFPGQPVNVKNVRVLDEHTGAVLATVNVGRQPEMLAVDEVTGRVFVANRGDDTVSMIDPA